MNKKSLLELLKEKSDNMFTISGVNGLLDLLDKFSHQIEDQDETIHELQTVLKFRTNENKELYKEINRLKEVIKIKDDERIELVEENKNLKEENEKLKLGEYTEFRKMISDLWKGVDE